MMTGTSQSLARLYVTRPIRIADAFLRNEGLLEFAAAINREPVSPKAPSPRPPTLRKSLRVGFITVFPSMPLPGQLGKVFFSRGQTFGVQINFWKNVFFL